MIQSSPTTTDRFGPIAVSPAIARALRDMGYQVPTPIQEQAIPPLRSGKDVLGQAQTGTGKTAGFGIPLLEAIDPARREVQAIVLVPTRELCIQVAEELTRIGAHLRVGVVAVYGGVGFGKQLDGLKRGAQIVVGTPGRVEDLIARGSLRLDRVRFAVLDEADRMLDVGFLPPIERILGKTPATRQTALFSATMPDEVRSLANRQMREPVTVAITPEKATVEEIEQRFERVPDGDKMAALQAYLDQPSCFLALVFRRTTYKADKLARDLNRRGYKVGVLHGRRSQSQRERVLADLKSAKLQALIATDIAARGLDIAGLTHVFNFDLPDTPETYVHRIGRTGRAGEVGTAITFVGPEDEDELRAIERHLAGKRTGSDQQPRGGVKPAQNRPQPGSGNRRRGRRPSGDTRSSSQPSSDRRRDAGRDERRWPRQGRDVA